MDINKTATRRAKRWISFALAGLMVVGAFAGGASAHASSEDHGEVTLHDSEDGEPQTLTATEPDPVELTCEFWVKGHNLSHQSGWINATSGSGPSVEVTTVGTFNGTENENGTYDFDAGPFTLEETDDYYVYLRFDAEGQHGPPQHDVEYEACDGSGDGDQTQNQPPACPANLQAHAQQNENVRLGWDASANASTYHVYRATEDGDMQHVAEVESTNYTDTETEAETTYTYEVTAANEAGEAENCPTAEVTAIPFFGSPALVAMAALGSVGAVGALRVRRG
jgi:hypothetical protein